MLVDDPLLRPTISMSRDAAYRISTWQELAKVGSAGNIGRSRPQRPSNWIPSWKSIGRSN